MTLTYNEKTGDYVLVSNDRKRAQDIGMTLSRSARGPNGEHVWFTKEPYAALSYWKEADARVKEKLDFLYKEYAASWAKDFDGDFPRPKGLEFMPFQRGGIAYALRHGHTLIGDEPGLGKTIQGIGVANAREAQKVLVICPGAVRLHWQRKIREWSTMPRVSTYPILKSSDGVNPYSNYVIISYDLARNLHLHEALCEIDWDMVISDETHYLKTPDAKRTQAVFGGGRGPFGKRWLSQRVENVLALTGTPLPNRPRECFMVAKSLCPESIDWATYDEFCYRFNPAKRMESVSEDGDTKVFNKEERGRLPELQARLRCNFMVRRLKRDVLKDLPDKQWEITYVEPNGAIKDAMLKESLHDIQLEDLKDPNAEIWGQISTIRREMGEAMAPRVVEHIHYLMRVMELPKLVIFSHHRSVMAYIENELNREYGLVTVKGGMTAVQKDQAVQIFQQPDGPKIWQGQMQAAGEGIDGLQNVASHVVFAEPAWVPKDNDQPLDRCHRIGQHSNVVGQLMMVEGSLSERMLGTVVEKAQVIHSTLDDALFALQEEGIM